MSRRSRLEPPFDECGLPPPADEGGGGNTAGAGIDGSAPPTCRPLDGLRDCGVLRRALLWQALCDL
eukprot:1124993-Prymnesium_polylepis.1